jgi:hypothetical protein
MEAELLQAGERQVLRSAVPWVDAVLGEGADGELRPPGGRPADVEVEVERSTAPFDVAGWEPLTRGASRRGRTCVLHDACGSGFDLLVDARDVPLRVVARWRPPSRERVAALLLRSRFHLLARAVLLQYPAMWRAGVRGRVPLHASALTLGDRVPLLVGPGGVGRSSLLLAGVRGGGRPCSDNLVVGDDREVLGVVEPVRVEGGSGRRMAHGRREQPLPGRLPGLVPDAVVVLRRGTGAQAVVRPVDAAHAARTLTAGTYMAGELRRYWAFAGTLALGTGLGPPHPAVGEVAAALAHRLPAVEITLAARPTGDPVELLRGALPERGLAA